MKTYTHARRSASRGLTLIELVVVLAILVALAGLIIGNFPGIVKKAGRSSSATSIQDVTRAVQYAYTTTLKYPNNYDSLIEAGGALFTKLPSAVGLTGSTVDPNHAAALALLGITKSFLLTTNAADATWSVTTITPAFNGADGQPIAKVGGGIVNGMFPQESASDVYYIFGIGSACDMVGPSKTMIEAPTHFGDSANENPKEKYGRYGVIYGVNPSNQARFIGAVAFSSSGLVATEGNIKEYWNN